MSKKKVWTPQIVVGGYSVYTPVERDLYIQARSELSRAQNEGFGQNLTEEEADSDALMSARAAVAIFRNEVSGGK